MNPAPQEIDVHRLSSEEAFLQVKKAIRDARGFGAPQLRIIVGKGNHSKNNVPVLKPAIMSELQKYVTRFLCSSSANTYPTLVVIGCTSP